MIAACRVAGIVVLILTTRAAWSQNEHPQGRGWDISAWVSLATGEENTNSFQEAQLWRGGFFLGKAITGEAGNGLARGTLEYAFDIVPLWVQSRPRVIYGVGFEPVVLRWNFSEHINRVRPYIELAGGGLSTTSNLPDGNTSSFNFSARGGGGINILSGKRQSWDVGLCWLHISNANLGVRNPEFNGLELSVGYHWFK